MVKAIIFDLWNTLAAKKISISTELKNHFCIDVQDYLPRYERIMQLKKWESIEDLAENFLDSFALPLSEANIIFITKTFNKGIKSAILYAEARELLEDLSKTCKLAVLSNTTVFEVVQERWSITHLFDKIFYSWKTGLLKPEKQTFISICSRLGVKPEECIFIDDTNMNVTAAKNLGMNALQYKNMDKLRKDLRVFLGRNIN